jgi:tryptophan-rich sensory protein
VNAGERQPSWVAPGSLLKLGGAVVVCFVAVQLGSAATRPNISPWYEGLAKPFFTPPNLAFPIAWTLLFALLAIALWRVLVLGSGEAKRQALVAFGVQLAFNIGWSFAFFASHSPLLGLVDIVLLVVAIVWTILRFRAIDAVAAWLLAPYLAWVLYACALNAAILFLNA